MEDKYSTDYVAASPESPRMVDGKDAFDAEKKQHKKKRGALSLIKAALMLMRGASNRKPKCEEVQVGSQDMIKKIVGSMRPLHLQDNPCSPPPSSRSFPSPSPSLDSFHDIFPSPSSPLMRSTYAASCADTMSSYASFANLQELDMGSRCPSVGNLQELAAGGGSRCASMSNLDMGSRCPSSGNLQDLAAGGGANPAEASTSGISRRWASMGNLQELDGGLGGDRRCASTSNLQVLDAMPESDDEMIDAKADLFIARFYEQISLQRSDSVARYNERMASALR